MATLHRKKDSTSAFHKKFMSIMKIFHQNEHYLKILYHLNFVEKIGIS